MNRALAICDRIAPMSRLILTILAALAITLSALADVTLPSFFSEGMVLQRDRPCPVWGRASVGEAVTVTFRGQTVRTTADALGRWRVALAPTAAGAPFELTVAGAANTVAIQNVAVGEVWVASGQSNMGFAVARGNDAAKEIAASTYPQIRFFHVAKTVSETPLEDAKGEWKASMPATAGDFSAVAYFFARNLHEKLGVPIGILQTEWGGTPAEAWTSPSALAADPALRQVFVDWAEVLEQYPNAMARYELAMKEFEAGKRKSRPGQPNGPNYPHMPSGLYNAMISPLVPYAIRGAIWYQGENNAHRGRAELYRRLFPAMITDWRNAWKQGDFPFLFVQLANFAKVPEAGEWPELREAQRETLSLANTGMAVTVDVGDPQDIHPTNKQDVGLRLALAARGIVYGEKVVYAGPLFRQTVRDGSSMRVYFDHTGGGLKLRGAALNGFEVAGAEGKWIAADARVDGETVVASAPGVREPVRVRYAWANDPPASLFNAEGLPASPFQSK